MPAGGWDREGQRSSGTCSPAEDSLPEPHTELLETDRRAPSRWDEGWGGGVDHLCLGLGVASKPVPKQEEQQQDGGAGGGQGSF